MIKRTKFRLDFMSVLVTQYITKIDQDGLIKDGKRRERERTDKSFREQMVRLHASNRTEKVTYLNVYLELHLKWREANNIKNNNVGGKKIFML